MKVRNVTINFMWTCGVLLGCLFINFQAVAVTTDPLRQLVKTNPVGKTLKFSPTFEGRGDGVHTCPVTGEKITAKSFKTEYFGRTVYFCCKGCLKSAQRTPEKYIKPSMAEQLQAVKAYLVKVPQAPSGEEYCNE